MPTAWGRGSGPSAPRPAPDIELATEHPDLDKHRTENVWADATDHEIQLTTPFVASSLAWQSVPSHNAHTAPLPLSAAERKRLFMRTAAVLSMLLVASALALVLIVKLALPVLSEEDRAALRIPRSFEQLQALNTVLQNYSHTHYARVLIAYTACYLLYVPLWPP